MMFELTLTDEECWLLADYLKRFGFADARINTRTNDEAQHIMVIVAKIQDQLIQNGYITR